MRSLLLATTLVLVGCGETVPLVKLDVDERLLARCPKTLPVLPSGEDTAGLGWSSSMLSLYAKCAKDHESLAKVIEDYNEKIDKASNPTSPTSPANLGTERSE
jgi:hypothetical protein